DKSFLSLFPMIDFISWHPAIRKIKIPENSIKSIFLKSSHSSFIISQLLCFLEEMISLISDLLVPFSKGYIHPKFLVLNISMNFPSLFLDKTLHNMQT